MHKLTNIIEGLVIKMQSVKTEQKRKFISVDPAKCIGCGICEYACTVEKGEANWNPMRSRIRVVRMAPAFNFALSCRGCKDARCVKACPEHAIMQTQDTGLLVIDDKACKGCDWCVQACEHGGITINPETGKAIACDLCQGEPKCKEACPEEALEIVESDEAADKRFNEALAGLAVQCEQMTTMAKNKDWKPLLATAEKRSEKVSATLEKLNKKTMDKRQK